MHQTRMLHPVAFAAVLGIAIPVFCYGQAAQEKLAVTIKEAREETQRTRAQLQSTISTLNDLQNQKSGDLKPNYDKYSASIEDTRKAAAATRKRYDTMSADSKSYFDAWRSDLNGISNKDIRKVSEKRLKAVEKDYGETLKKLGLAKDSFGPMMSDLDDFKKALGNDLTPNGLKALSKSLARTNKALANAQAPVVRALLSFDSLSKNLMPTAQ